MKSFYTTFKKFFLVIFLGLTFISAAFSAFIIHSLLDLQSVRALEHYSPSLPTRVLDVKGRLITEFYAEKRELVTFEEVPPQLIQAILVTEDERFFDHYGFNPWRIIKAAFINLARMKKAQGGSTITIQLSKLLFLSPERTIKRKIYELWYAIQIERLYSKKEILLFYFNQIYFGHGCYGIKSATKFFFNKDLHELTMTESAMLAAIPKSPRDYSLLRKPKSAMRRHRSIMYNLVSHGYISKDHAAKQFNDFWLRHTSKLRSRESTVADLENNQAPYFIERIRHRLEKEIGKKDLYKGGFNIYTTLNLEHQKSAQTHLWKALKNQNRINEKRHAPVDAYIDRNVISQADILTQLFGINGDAISQTQLKKKLNVLLNKEVLQQMKVLSLLTGQNQLFSAADAANLQNNFDGFEKVEGAIISIDPSTGYITSLVGGRGFSYYNQFDHVFLAKRQIGSLMKPFVYAAAIDQKKITASTLLNDTPVAFGLGNGDVYIPQNYTGTYQGPVVARDALRKSINIPAIMVADKTGIPIVRNYASQIFRSFSQSDLREKFPPDLTMALGTGSFAPIDVASAYAVLANEGREVIPKTIRYITDRNGEMIKNYRNRGNERQILSPGTAYILTKLLSGVFEPGGTASQEWKLISKFKHASFSSGKTGTTSNWTDAWFAGYNKHLVTIVWIGYSSNKSLGKGRSSAIAVPVWLNFNIDVVNRMEKNPYVRPNDVVKRLVDRETGDLATPSSKHTYEENFLKGTAPEGFTTKHMDDYLEARDFAKKMTEKDKKKGLENFLDFIHKEDTSSSDF